MRLGSSNIQNQKHWGLPLCCQDTSELNLSVFAPIQLHAIKSQVIWVFTVTNRNFPVKRVWANLKRKTEQPESATIITGIGLAWPLRTLSDSNEISNTQPGQPHESTLQTPRWGKTCSSSALSGSQRKWEEVRVKKESQYLRAFTCSALHMLSHLALK